MYIKDKFYLRIFGSMWKNRCWLCAMPMIIISGFKPRDSSIDARKRRKSIQKSRRYHSMSFRYKKTTQAVEVSLEKSIVAVKTLKGIYRLSIYNTAIVAHPLASFYCPACFKKYLLTCGRFFNKNCWKTIRLLCSLQLNLQMRKPI